MTGDWGGARTWLSENGIIVDVQATQFYQGVVDGALDYGGKYGLKVDYFLTLLGEKLGLWKGFNVIMHGETRQGQDVNDQTGISPANANLLAPTEDDVTALTGLILTQRLPDEWLLMAGKLNAWDFVDIVYHTGRGVDKFMNTSLLLPLGLAGTVPLGPLGGGILKLKGKEVQGAVLAYDPNNCATTSCFDPAFNNGAGLVGLWKFFHGSQQGARQAYISIGGTWSSKEYTVVDRNSITVVPGEGIELTDKQTSWSIFGVAEQPLWVDPVNPNRELRFKGMYTLTDGVANPVKWTATASLEMSGLVPGRDKDTIGVGYFHDGLAGDFKDTVGPLLSLAATLESFETTGSLDPKFVSVRNTNGLEVYYKAALTAWFAVTGDLQVITPNLSVEDTKVVTAVRGKIDF
jgi:porin